MSKDIILTEREGFNLIVTINRNEKRNAINEEVMHGLRVVFEGVEADPKIRSISTS